MKIPITLITGYLGAGKTTLLRHIVDNLEGRKYAILMNEFGIVDIDSRVVQGKNIAMIELKGGCVCCSLTGEFEAAIEEIREQVRPELIVIETTGVAEPDAIIGDLGSIKGVRLDAVITVVDVEAIFKYPSIGHTGRVQIESADIILLNKADLVGDENLEEIEKKITGINSRATIIPTTKCDVDLGLIFDVEAKRPDVGHKHGHVSDLDSFIYESSGKMNREKLEDILSRLPSDIHRTKGFARTDSGDFLVNVVFGRIDFEEFPSEQTQLVFIGKNIRGYAKSVVDRLKECEL